MTYLPRAQYRDVDVGEGLRLRVVELGGGPPIVFLHGFTGSTETWESFQLVFAERYRTIAVDLPGHGGSSDPDDPLRYSLDRVANDLAKVLDELGVERIALIGYSMGGRAAIRFALSHAPRVAALILESTSPGIADPGLREDRRAADEALADDIEQHGIEAFVDRWETLSLWETQRDLPAETQARLRAQRLANRPRGLANSLRGAGAANDVPTQHLLQELRVPSLILAGARDDRYVELGNMLGASLPNSTMVIIPEAGHAAHLEQPRAFADAIARFLSGVPSSGDCWI